MLRGLITKIMSEDRRAFPFILRFLLFILCFVASNMASYEHGKLRGITEAYCIFHPEKSICDDIPPFQPVSGQGGSATVNGVTANGFKDGRGAIAVCGSDGHCAASGSGQ